MRQPSPYAAFRASTQAAPQAPFLIAPASAELPYAPEGFRLSYGSVAAQVEGLERDYRAAGYGRGARVALLMDNRPDFFAHWLALNALGVSIVPINPDLKPDELSFQLALSEADLLVATADRAEGTAGADLGGARLIRVGEPLPPCRGRVVAQDGAAEDECALLFTSGSTGKPKGCVLSNRYFMKLAEWYVTQGGVASLRRGAEIVLTPLPMFHMNALGCSAVGMMVLGGAVVPLDRFHARRWWQAVAESGATVVHCLGVIPAILLQLPETEAERRHAVRFALAPGVDARHRATFEERYRIPIVEAWAMTETGGAAATTTAREPAGFGPRCIGRPAGGMEYRLVDDQGCDVPIGKPGELLVRARSDPRDGFFGGYLKDEAATEAAWEGGWFHTGDLVYADSDGLMYFFDRKKSIVRRSGENIAVLEVEAALHMDEAVEACAVAPVPDEIRGEEVFAFVVGGEPDPGEAGALAERIVRSCADRLAYHKLPGYVAFVDALPLSSTKKLARGEIKVLAGQALAAGRAIDLREVKAQLRHVRPQRTSG